MITGDEIRAARKRAGLSQAALAKRVGVVQRTVGGWERGENTPGLAEPKLMAVLRDYLDDDSTPPLRSVSDVELLAEIARRFARGQRERGEDGGDAAPIEPTVEGVLAAQAAHLQAVAQDGDPSDADVVDDLARKARERQTGK